MQFDFVASLKVDEIPNVSVLHLISPGVVRVGGIQPSLEDPKLTKRGFVRGETATTHHGFIRLFDSLARHRCPKKGGGLVWLLGHNRERERERESERETRERRERDEGERRERERETRERRERETRERRERDERERERESNIQFVLR